MAHLVGGICQPPGAQCQWHSSARGGPLPVQQLARAWRWVRDHTEHPLQCVCIKGHHLQHNSVVQSQEHTQMISLLAVRHPLHCSRDLS